MSSLSEARRGWGLMGRPPVGVSWVRPDSPDDSLLSPIEVDPLDPLLPLEFTLLQVITQFQ